MPRIATYLIKHTFYWKINLKIEPDIHLFSISYIQKLTTYLLISLSQKKEKKKKLLIQLSKLILETKKIVYY